MWLFTPAVKEACSRKLAAQWHGPYTVVDKKAPSIPYAAYWKCTPNCGAS